MNLWFFTGLVVFPSHDGKLPNLDDGTNTKDSLQGYHNI